MNKKIMILWAIVVVMLLSTLLIIGYNKRDKIYIALEKELNSATLKYLNDKNMIPEYNESAIVFVNNLIDEEYIKDNKNIKKYCIESIAFTKGLVKDKYEILANCKSEE